MSQHTLQEALKKKPGSLECVAQHKHLLSSIIKEAPWKGARYSTYGSDRD